MGDVRRPLRRDPGQTTLLAGDTEIVIKTSVTPHTLLGAVRTYRIAGTGAVIAVRSALPGKSGVDYELTDPHGTATLEMDTATQAVSRTQYTPFGAGFSSALDIRAQTDVDEIVIARRCQDAEFPRARAVRRACRVCRPPAP